MKNTLNLFFIIFTFGVSAQNIGINTATPSNTLSVNGRVDIAQKLGIGTTAPTGELHVMSSTSSTTVIDQQQENYNTIASGNNIWQSFTAGVSGSLTQVALKVASPIGSSSSLGTINIYAGEGISGALLSKISVTFEPFISDFQPFTLPNFVNVLAGNKYTIELYAPVVNDYWILYQNNNPYAGGTISYNTDYDMPFQTTVLPSTDALVVQNAKVGIGTTNPSAKLDIAGNIKITDGTQGAGKVLTSDTNGLATWATPTGGGGFSSGTAAGNTPFWNGTIWVPNSSNIYNNGSFVGIGTTNPATKLHVVGGLKIDGGFNFANGTEAAGHVLTSNANGHANWELPLLPSGSQIGNTPFWDGTRWNPNSNAIYNNGNFVGIGTTNPNTKLHIVGSFKVDGPVVLANGTEAAGHVLTSNANGHANWELPLLPSGSQIGNTPFWDGTRWNPNSNAIYNNGNFVGMGTTNPNTKLHVVGSFKVDGPVVLANGTQGAGKVLTSDANGLASWELPVISSGWSLNGNAGTSFASNFLGTTDNRSLRIRTNNTEKMVVDSLGRVGIGTKSPTAMLHIKTGALVCDDAVQRFFVNGGFKWDIAGFASSYEISRSGVAVDFYINGTNGNVGIGTSAPTAKLSVSGNANNTTGSWSVFSDARIKTVKSDFTDGLNVISKIQPVTFNYNAHAPLKAEGEQIGIVAQDLEKIAPYMVSQKEYGNLKDLREVNNQAYVYLLINAVKELSAQNEHLKAELELIKTRLDLNIQANNR